MRYVYAVTLHNTKLRLYLYCWNVNIGIKNNVLLFIYCFIYYILLNIYVCINYYVWKYDFKQDSNHRPKVFKFSCALPTSPPLRCLCRCSYSAKTRYWCWSGFFNVILLVQKNIHDMNKFYKLTRLTVTYLTLLKISRC